VDVSFCMHEISQEELVTAQAVVDSGNGILSFMPTHGIDEGGKLKGFTYTCRGESHISSLPISREMFHGHSAFECKAESKTIISLLSDPAGMRSKMRTFLLAVRNRLLQNYSVRKLSHILFWASL